MDARPHGPVRVHLVGAGDARTTPAPGSAPRRRAGWRRRARRRRRDRGWWRRSARDGVGEVPVRVGDRLERVPTGPADHRRPQLVAELPDRVEREVAQQAVEPVDVRVERLAADAEPGGQRGERERLDARLVDQGAGGLDRPRRGRAPPASPCAASGSRQSDGLSKIPGGISRATPRSPRRRAVPAGAGGEPGGTGQSPRPTAAPPMPCPALDRERAGEREVPLRVDRRPVVAQARLGQRGELVAQRHRGVAGGARRARPGSPSPRRNASSARTARPVRIRSSAGPWPMMPRQAHGAAVDERHAPPSAEHAEHRVVGRHAEVAPQRELEAARDRVALDRRDHRLGRAACGSGPSARRRRARRELTRSPPGSDIALRSAPAQKVPSRAGEHRDRERVVGVEARRTRRRSASAVGRSTALRASGRSMVTTATGPSTS